MLLGSLGGRVPPPSAHQRRLVAICGRLQNEVRAQDNTGPALAILARDVDRSRGRDAREVLLAGLGLAFGGRVRIGVGTCVKDRGAVDWQRVGR